MHRLALVALFTLPVFANAQPGQFPPGAPTTHQIKLNGHTFTLPKDSTIELAAGADLAPRPIVAAFDEKGRLYVCDSSGSNERTSIQVEKKPHRIVRLEDTNGDGKFDKQTVFVKHVMFPEGAMWLNGSLYVAAPPHIWKFTDTNDDGIADKEEIWFDGKTLTGCANDLHGPYRGPDGHIYWCKGAFAKQDYTLPNGKKFATRAAHIFRARPDGTHIEPVMTGGMDNPVDTVFMPGGDIIFSTTFFQHPGNGKRDGLIHAVYGGVYGKDHNVVYEHPWTSPELMPVLTHMGPAAPCGLHRYESNQFGKDYANNIFCSQFNMRKVSRHVLVPKGSTYESTDSDFVVSDNIDFHPTDVIEDADGSLLIVDTGGWYKLCCPTSQLVKPDVTGAIYRVKRIGAHKVDDPRGLKIDWAKIDLADLTLLLDDPRPVVRVRAANTLVARGDAGIKQLAKILFVSAYSEEAWQLAIATLTGVDHPEARKAARYCLGHLVGENLALTGIHAVALWRDKKAIDDLISLLLRNGDRRKRAAATALGRIGDPKAIPALFTALANEKNDRVLDHALTYALIEIGDAKETAKGLTHPSPPVRRACLATMENIPNANLDAKDALVHLDAKNSALRETAWWIAGRHPQWGDQLADYFAEKLKAAEKLTPAERDELASRSVKFASSTVIQKLLGDELPTAKPDAARLIIGVMTRSGLKTLPDPWRNGLLAAAPNLDDRETLRAALGVFRILPGDAKDYDAFVAKLPRERLWPGGIVPTDFRLALLVGRPAGQTIDNASLNFLLQKLDREEPTTERSSAAEGLVRSTLNPEQLILLAKAIKNANPLDFAKLLNVFAKSTDDKVGLALVKVLREKEVRASIRTEMIKPILEKYSKAVKDEAEKLYAELAEARKGETQRLEKTLAELKPGDIRRGQLVFNSKKTNCIACHKVGYVGGLVGPDLTRIGNIRTERDLLESILFPSASFVRSYEPVRVVTTDQRILNGVLKKDAPDEIVIVVAADKEERVARADIESIAPSTVSLMPAGLEQQLTPQELADLIAFLRACK